MNPLNNVAWAPFTMNNFAPIANAILAYIEENHSLRTISINSVFSAISSISQNLSMKKGNDKAQKIEKLQEVYLAFGSSNFFWENLEKNAKLGDEVRGKQFFMQQVVSYSGKVPPFCEVSNTMQTADIFSATCKFHFSGDTIFYIFRESKK